MRPSDKAPEPLLPPVDKFNHIVGAIFNNCRMPSDKHCDCDLQRGLSWVVDTAYNAAKNRLEAYNVPYEERHERVVESQLYIDNLRYLRRRFNNFRRKLGCSSILREDARLSRNNSQETSQN